MIRELEREDDTAADFFRTSDEISTRTMEEISKMFTMLATCFCFGVCVPLLLILCLLAVYCNLIVLKHVTQANVGECLATSVLCQLTTKILVIACIVVMWLASWFVMYDQEFHDAPTYLYVINSLVGITSMTDYVLRALYFNRHLRQDNHAEIQHDQGHESVQRCSGVGPGLYY